VTRRLIPLLLTLFAHHAFAQLELKLDGTEAGKKLSVVLSTWETRHNVKFYYMPVWIDQITIDSTFEGETLNDALDVALDRTGISYIAMNEHVIVLVKDPTNEMQRRQTLSSALIQKKQVSRLTIGSATGVTTGKRVNLRGRIIDKESKSPLIGAVIRILDNDALPPAVTNADGRFEVQLPAGANLVSVSYVDYEGKILDLAIYEDAELTIDLEEIARMLDEIVIAGSARGQNTTNHVGQTQISMREIKRAPSMLGETDLIRQVQVLPGVTTVGEAAAGFNVRGGGTDQNLVLYDDVPVFNSSHAFGFFSSFNAEAVRDVSFYRGGIPAEYGGRASSVLDIRSREGDYDKWGFSGGIGMISSHAMVNGPIVKGSTSVAASVRWTYSDWLVNTIRTNYTDLRNASVFFYDGTVKIAHKFSDKTKLTFSGYSSRDQFQLKDDSAYRWNNLLGSIRLDHQASPNLGLSVTLGSGSYQYLLYSDKPESGFDLSYNITYPFLKGEVHYQAGTHRITTGVQSMFYRFDPGTLNGRSGSTIGSVSMERQYNLETAFYASDAISLAADKVSIEGGIRVSMFNSIGPATINLYEEGTPPDISTFTGTMEVPKGEFYKTYIGLEPRASARYSFTPTLSAKAGYNRMYQYMHLVSNTTAVTPIDIWQPSGTYFKPQIADQLSLGLFKDFKDKTYETYVEAYYKTINNITDFEDGAELILNPHLETDLLQGVGTTYGIETSFAKSTGRFTGSLNYTYSRSLRQIAGPTEQESINNGEQYPSNYDQPHMVNFSWKMGLTRRVFFTGYFTYRTGRPVTVPESGFVVDDIPVAGFSERNQYRVPDYHRLDLALVIEGNHKRRRILDGTLTFSIYNVYSRQNAYTIFFRENEHGYMQPYKLSIIGTALPSCSYTFRI
jgi:hypothetical protein